MVKLALGQISSESIKLELNYLKIKEYVLKASEAKADMVCFPELALTGYCRLDLDKFNAAEQANYLEELAKLAVDKNIAICFGAVEQEADKYYITQYICTKTGEKFAYRKTHLGEREAEVFEPGEALEPFEVENIGNVGILLCSDNHYPEAALTLASKGARLILAPFAVPGDCAKRRDIWNKFLVARAYDNRVFVAAVNQLGFTKNGKAFAGGAVVYNPQGEVLAEAFTGTESLLICEVDLEESKQYWQKESKKDSAKCFVKFRKSNLYI